MLADDRGTPDDTPGVDDRLALMAALQTLTAKQRAVVVLRFYEDMTEQQAAHVLGVSVGTVKSQTHVALQRLRGEVAGLRETETEAT